MISDAGMPNLCRMPTKEVCHFQEMPWHTISVGLACKHNDNSLSIKLSFACSWAHLDTYRHPGHAPQNRLQNGWAVVEVSELLFLYFLPYAHHLLSHLIWSICMILDPFGYLHTPWRRSTEPFMKQLSCCKSKSTCMSCFFALCSPSAQSLTIAHFAWCWAQLDTLTLCEDAPQNRLQNGWAVVEVSPLVFRVFLLILSAKSLTISDVTAWLSLPVAQGARAAFLALGCPDPALTQLSPHWLSQKRNRVHVQPPILSYFINFGALHQPGGLMVSMLCFIGCFLMSSHELCVQFLMHVYFLWGL